MKISEMGLLEIKQGLRFKSLDGSMIGTVVAVDYLDDFSVYYIWDGEKEVSYWFGNDCDCEVLEEEDNLVYSVKEVKRELLIRQEDFNKALLKFASQKSKDKNSKLFGLKLPTDDKVKLNTILEKMF